MRAITAREIEFRLNRDFNAFRRSHARAFRPDALGQLFELSRGIERNSLVNRESRLRIVDLVGVPARAVFTQPSRHFPPPFGFFGGLGFLHADGYGFRYENRGFFFGWNFADRALHVRSEQQSATLRADSNHWSVLRCGLSSGALE